LADFLNSPFGLLVVGFFLTALVGTFVSQRLQVNAARSQTERDLQVEVYREGTRFLSELSELAGQRFFGLQRWLWSIEDPEQYNVEGDRREYFRLVQLWNQKAWANRAALRLLVGEAEAGIFLDYEDDGRLEQPRSLHYRFHRAHQVVLDTERDVVGVSAAQEILDELNREWSAYIESVTSRFMERAAALKLLEKADAGDGHSPWSTVVGPGGS
jgi:hypothetical protein